jgi:hypothetical protein
VPGKLAVIPNTNNPASSSLRFATAPGHWYQVQATADFVNWTNIYQTATATNNSVVNYVDPQAGTFSKRFYRLQMH